MTGIYLDHAATAPLRAEALEAMLPWLREGFGNPSSPHAFGRAARRAVEEARESVAALLGVEPRGIVFTSGGTESNHLALCGCVGACADHAPRMLVTAVEHHSVLDCARRLASTSRARLEVISVDDQGRMEIDAFGGLLTQGAALVSVQHVNNETGVVQPMREIGVRCDAHGALLHVDAVQSAGLLPIDAGEWGAALLSVSAHKIGGPKGVGALWIRDGIRITPMFTGGGQEHRRRAGTQNVAGIAGFGAACRSAARDRDGEATRIEALRRHAEDGLLAAIPGVWVNGAGAERAPHILNVGFEGVEGEGVLFALDARGIAVSTGAACTSGEVGASHVLLAMGQSHRSAGSAIRISMGSSTTLAEMETGIDAITSVVAMLRAQAAS